MRRFAPAVVVSATTETSAARTLEIDIADWPGHIAGQHIDVKLTAPDGYSAVRSYSIASSAVDSVGRPVTITVDRLEDGEVSPYLVDGIAVGEQLEVRGPAGGWFTWSREDTRPVQLIGGGSGIVPLMAMIRTRRDSHGTTPFRLLYSVRSPEMALFRDELLHGESMADAGADVDVTWAFSRATPAGWRAPPARLTSEAVASAVFAPDAGARTYICGSTPFVESVANWLVDAGHDPADIKTERYGG